MSRFDEHEENSLHLQKGTEQASQVHDATIVYQEGHVAATSCRFCVDQGFVCKVHESSDRCAACAGEGKKTSSCGARPAVNSLGNLYSIFALLLCASARIDIKTTDMSSTTNLTATLFQPYSDAFGRPRGQRLKMLDENDARHVQMRYLGFSISIQRYHRCCCKSYIYRTEYSGIE